MTEDLQDLHAILTNPMASPDMKEQAAKLLGHEAMPEPTTPPPTKTTGKPLAEQSDYELFKLWHDSQCQDFEAALEYCQRPETGQFKTAMQKIYAQSEEDARQQGENFGDDKSWMRAAQRGSADFYRIRAHELRNAHMSFGPDDMPVYNSPFAVVPIA